MDTLRTLLAIFVLSLLPLSALATDAQREAIIETARKYLVHGLLEHKPELVPLAETAWRLEQGENTGRSGAEIKRRLLKEEYKVIAGISNERWLVEGDEAVVFYDLHIHGMQAPVLIAERFKVVGGLIEEIEALIYQPPG